LRTITTAALGGLAISLLTAPPAWADTFQVNTIADRVDANVGDGVCADAMAPVIVIVHVTSRSPLAAASSSCPRPGWSWPPVRRRAGSSGPGVHRRRHGERPCLRCAGQQLEGERRWLPVHRDAEHQRLDRRRQRLVGTGASGGGAFNSGGTLTVEDSTFDSNTATRAGGAIEANAGTTAVRRSTLSNNSTGSEPGNGGGQHLTDTGTVSVSNSRVVANTANAEGGGL